MNLSKALLEKAITGKKRLEIEYGNDRKCKRRS
jgi:hypothetical protein